MHDLEERGLLGVALANGDRVCLIRCEDTVTAVRDLCTHQAFPLSEGDLLPGGKLVCAWHGAEFDCASGHVRRGPALDPLVMYDVQVAGTDIYVRGRQA
jgi:nitrite reductase/ring-hydroxylating ferredoxin subunit